MTKLDRLVARAKRMGLERACAELLEAYLQPEDHTEAFKGFHWGNPPDRTIKLRAEPLSSHAWCLGPLVAVTYEAWKADELAHWHHEFEDERPYLAATSPTQLLVLGGSYRVTRRGIVG